MIILTRRRRRKKMWRIEGSSIPCRVRRQMESGMTMRTWTHL
jgi:hypothetical protein